MCPCGVLGVSHVLAGSEQTDWLGHEESPRSRQPSQADQIRDALTSLLRALDAGFWQAESGKLWFEKSIFVSVIPFPCVVKAYRWARRILCSRED